MYCQNKNGYEVFKDVDKMTEFCEGYKKFLDAAKTEREAVDYVEAKVKDFDGLVFNNRGKCLIMVKRGLQPLENGVNIIASHIDSPRLDLKQNPLFEDVELAMFKTHYYGGIKKYQWTAIPLALHGVVITKDGKTVKINIGEKPNDFVFTITDLLPHLSGEQSKKKTDKAIEGENLRILIGSQPFVDSDEKGKVKKRILQILKDEYNIEEEDFLSAELEVVPAFKAQDIGFDRSLVGGYGQDDRVCSYAAFQAMMEIKEAPDKTAVLILADKEEVGSMGNTGMQSHFFEDVLADLCEDAAVLRKCLRNSSCISADVGAGIDPNYKSVQDEGNAGKMNHGTFIMKYGGSRGKSGSSDASAEILAFIRKLFDDNGVLWQTGELGKVDAGGGGTVAQFIANLNVEVIDIGVPLLSMHAPFEVAAKLDIYMTYKGFGAFWRS